MGLEMEKQVLEKECNVCQVTIFSSLHTYINTFIFTAFNIGVSGGLYAGGESLSLPSKPDFHCEDKAAAVWLPAFHSIHEAYFAEVNRHGISTGRSKKRSGRLEKDDS